MKRLLVCVLLPVIVLGVSGCAAGDADEVSSSGPSVLDQESTGLEDANSDGMKTAEVDFSQGRMSAVVHPLQVVGDHSVLTVDLAFAEDAAGFIAMGMVLSGHGSENGAGGIRLVSLTSEMVWTPGLDGDGRSVATTGGLGMRAGDQERVAVFFGPVQESTVDVMIPSIGLVSGVPVVRADADPVSLDSLGEFAGEVSFPDAAPIESFTQAYDESGSVLSVGDEQTVTLASDVLFATDEYELTAQALSVVDAAGAAIAEAAGSGRVQVVGHTDDVGSDAYNLDLSQKRAASVAARLSQVLGTGFELVTEGRGESDPAVPDTSAEARAANRRVEIRFAAASSPELGTARLPEATIPVSSGHDPVEYLGVSNDGSYRAAINRVVRRDGYLVGQVTVTWAEGVENGAFGTNVLGRMGPLENIPMFFRLYTGWSLRVAGTSGWVYPAQHVVASQGEGDYVRPLVNRNNVKIDPGDSLDFVVIWPDLDPSADTITIEAPEMFRITDIPVEES